ncbi:MAG: lipopolysaccharide biosynthesis protein [Prevotella sp.]|nr:lipopolysaccharide biosynthesis protein [Prevotella sp.]
MTTLKEKTAKGLLWGGVSNGIVQLLNAVIGIFLARKLSQDDYGMVGMLAIFTALGTSLQEGGFIGALNKRKNATYNDFNAVFWTSVGISTSIYAILFFCAPLIARFYGVDELTPLARYIFLSFVISSFSTAPRAYLFRNMMVRETSIMTIISLAVSGVVAIWMAYQGMAYWGIATQTVVYITLIAAQSFYFAKWRPSLHVNFTPIREMIGFSSRLILTNVFNIINQNVFSVILGKMYTPKVVGDYTQANKWTTMGSSLISNMVYGIAQPVFTKVEEDRDRQKAVFRKLLRFTAFVCFPLMLGLALTAKEFIVILITDKWIASAGLMQVLCVAGAFLPIATLFSNLIISRGHSSTYMWCTIALCLIQTAIAIVMAHWGIYAMVVAWAIVNIAWTGVWLRLSQREITLHAIEFVRDISPYLVLSVVLCCCAHLCTGGINNIYLRFGAKIVAVAIPYIGILWMLGSTILKESVNYILPHHKTNTPP